MIELRTVAYINGVLFYPRCVSVTATVGGALEFSLNVPAVPQWELLPPRSHCAVFFTDPVKSEWRLLCEGEYDATGRNKLGTGQRSRELMFRSLFGFWEQANFTSVFGLGGHSLDSEIVRARANGQLLSFSLPNDSKYKIDALTELLDQAVAQFGSAQAISKFMPWLVEKVVAQTPVEAYYASQRRISQKMFSIEDAAIESVINYSRAHGIFINGLNSQGLTPSIPLAEILRRYESSFFYNHTHLPAPHLSDDHLAELLYIPALYNTVPPACNVIFDDQQTTLSMNRCFSAEPTRVISQLQVPLSKDNSPVMYMANADRPLVNVTAKSSEVSLSHDFLSEEELQKGVIAQKVDIGFERLTKTDMTNAPTATFDDYLAEAVGHQYRIAHEGARRAEHSCAFLPYLAPGFMCLVEDGVAPYYGMLDSVTHVLPCSGTPHTSVSLSHVRPAYVIEGKDRSIQLPRWLNTAFTSEDVAKTFSRVLGVENPGDELTSTIKATQVIGDISDDLVPGTQWKPRPTEVPKTGVVATNHSVDLDRTAARVVRTPQYTEAYELKDTYDDPNVVANKLRDAVIPQRAMLEYQYRRGVSLSDYIAFHKLSAAASNASSSEPPSELGNSPMFERPKGLELIQRSQRKPIGRDVILDEGESADSSIFGIYKIVGGVTDENQKIAKAIAAEISKGLTRG